MIRRALAGLALTAIVAHAANAQLLPNQALQCGRNGFGPGSATVGDRSSIRPLGSFTVEAWVRADANQSLSPYPIILSKPAGNLMNGDCSYGFIVERSTGRLIFRTTTSTGTFQAVATSGILDGAWHFLSGERTVSGNRLNLYVDGTLVASASATGTTQYSNESLCIGGVRFTGYQGNGFVGLVDEVRLWDGSHVSNEADRTHLFNVAPGLLSVWHFEQDYCDFWGGCGFVDSIEGAYAIRQDGAMMVPAADAPISRGSGMKVLTAMPAPRARCQIDMAHVVRLAGGRDLLQHVQAGALADSAYARVEAVRTSNAPVLEGSLELPITRAFVQMAARDSVVFCVKSIPSGTFAIHRLLAMRASDPSRLRLFGDSL